MGKNTGKDYEYFVGSIQQAILSSDELGFGGQKNIIVEVNKIIKDKFGIDRQFDIYWEFEIGGVKQQTIIECKDFKNPVSITVVDGLIGKLKDFPNLRGLIATRKGYQKGAKTKAESNGIDLLLVREQKDEDWTDKDGTPLIREAHIRMHIQSPARITNFIPKLSKENKGITSVHVQGNNNDIYIENNDLKTKYSLFDLQHILADKKESVAGHYSDIEIFTGTISWGDQSVIIDGYKVEYIIPADHIEDLVYDFSEALIGVVEYLHSEKKAIVFNNGKIRVEVKN